MKKIVLCLLGIVFLSSCGGNGEPTKYVYYEFNINNASKYTISKGDMHEFSCLFTQIFFSKEALTAMKNKKKFDFMNSDFTPTSIDLYKNKVYWVDIDLNTKIKNNFVKFENMGLSDEDPLFELIHKDNELIFRMETPHEGSTLVCDFPFRVLPDEELDEEGYPIQTICWGRDWDVVILKDNLVFLKNRSQPFTGKNLCKYENGQIEEEGSFKDGKDVGKWTDWYENGQKSEECEYEYSVGTCTQWHDNGQMMSDGSNKWYRDGKLKKKSYIKDGYDFFESWNHQGQITSLIQSKEGNFISETKYDYHYSNGSKKSVKNFNNNGKLHGKYTSWFKSGKVQLDANYKDGNEDGNYTLSFEDGRVIKRVYKDGECISGDC